MTATTSDACRGMPSLEWPIAHERLAPVATDPLQPLVAAPRERRRSSTSPSAEDRAHRAHMDEEPPAMAVTMHSPGRALNKLDGDARHCTRRIRGQYTSNQLMSVAHTPYEQAVEATGRHTTRRCDLRRSDQDEWHAVESACRHGIQTSGRPSTRATPERAISWRPRRRARVRGGEKESKRARASTC